MSPRPVDRLNAAAEGLREIRRLADGGRDAFDSSTDRQRALAYVWVTVGSALKDYSRDTGIAPGQPPFTAVIGYRDRLAHQALDRLDVEIVWETSVNRAQPLLRLIEELAKGQ